MTSDYGVESKVARVPKFGANGVCPMWNEDHIQQGDWARARQVLGRGQDVGGGDDSDFCVFEHDRGEWDCEELEQFVGPEVMLAFDESVRVPGVEHLLQNSLHDACKKIEGFEDWLQQATQVGRFFTNQYYLDMLEHSNFSSAGAQWVLKQLKTCGMAVPYTKRFGTVVSFLENWLFLSAEIRRFYDPSQWQKPPNPQGVQNPMNQEHV